MKRQERIRKFVSTIMHWFAHNKRDLPWRDIKESNDTQRAYKILVSEIMLQQTQVSRVIVKYKEFLDRFPTIIDLATASNKEVIIAWQGMGYNSRALRLRDAARFIGDRESGIWDQDVVFPRSMQELIEIPGIGHYTAAAILNFAFNEPTPCIDTNIRRILHRTFIGPESVDGTWQKSDRELLIVASDALDEVLNQGYSTRDWHAALMDYGSLLQTKTSPKWDECVLTQQGIMKTRPEQMPISNKTKRKKPTEPGRFMNKKFVPNRIFRGRIVQYLRQNPVGSVDDIGAAICDDWLPGDHRDWLQVLLEKLVDDGLIEKTGGEYRLRE